ncbi:MAG: SIR2 family protein [candidate division Zixibacteria bacterium]|nr:SIR2 family protein [candidate division Zixibacteria bacterium]MBU1471499.1 SIR2 family protein [candidate division Zixibacteria bacterium]MBU2625529.1 SIR2 family protein [candidate division Zixibacteria bacterium]
MELKSPILQIIPMELRDAQQDGNLVVFAGAGVSRDEPSGLPNFRRLTEELASRAGYDLNLDDGRPLDQHLGELAKKNSNLHTWTKDIFSNPDSKPNGYHKSLPRLFSRPEDVKIVTTNYDTHLSTAARAEPLNVGRIEVFCAPALPLGRCFSGIVHIHGSAHQEADRLILTDEDFGKAYMTDGWARRFLISMFANYHVLFIGYSHEDLMLTYLARGLFPGSRRYALCTTDKGDRWRNLGVQPIDYARTEGEPAHSAALVSRQHDIIGHVIDFRNCLRYICANKEVVDEKVHRSIIEGGA